MSTNGIKGTRGPAPRPRKPSQTSAPWILKEAARVNFYSTDLSGKWCIIRTPADIDAAWSVVCGLLETGQLMAAKVSTSGARKITGHTTHVICVYTRDWRDVKAVQAVREVLRNAGFVDRIGYKRDIDTMRPELNAGPEFIYED